MENLKNARRAKKLTQQEVADHLGIERSSYARYESGSREPDIETINALAKYLDVSVGYLSGSAVYSNADKLIDSYERSIHFWLEDQFFSVSEVDRLKDHYADVLTRYKTLVESLERAKTSEKYCIGENPTAIERYLHYYDYCANPVNCIVGWCKNTIEYFITLGLRSDQIEQFYKEVALLHSKEGADCSNEIRQTTQEENTDLYEHAQPDNSIVISSKKEPPEQMPREPTMRMDLGAIDELPRDRKQLEQLVSSMIEKALEDHRTNQ